MPDGIEEKRGKLKGMFVRRCSLFQHQSSLLGWFQLLLCLLLFERKLLRFEWAGPTAGSPRLALQGKKLKEEKQQQ